MQNAGLLLTLVLILTLLLKLLLTLGNPRLRGWTGSRHGLRERSNEAKRSATPQAVTAGWAGALFFGRLRPLNKLCAVAVAFTWCCLAPWRAGASRRFRRAILQCSLAFF